jgi:hypothetical protein
MRKRQPSIPMVREISSGSLRKVGKHVVLLRKAGSDRSAAALKFGWL